MVKIEYTGESLAEIKKKIIDEFNIQPRKQTVTELTREQLELKLRRKAKFERLNDAVLLSNKSEIVRLYRDGTGSGLVEAKQYVESLFTQNWVH
jgi:ribosomal protein L7/L12